MKQKPKILKKDFLFFSRRNPGNPNEHFCTFELPMQITKKKKKKKKNTLSDKQVRSVPMNICVRKSLGPS